MARERNYDGYDNFYEKAEKIINQYESKLTEKKASPIKKQTKNRNDMIINRLLYSSLTLAIILFVFMIYDTYFFI